MSAPSLAHERRRALLGQTAALAGLTVPVGIGVGLEPDVAVRHPSGRRLLVGDAKASEHPGCRATARRLRTYAYALLEPSRRGFSTRLVLAVPDDSEAVLSAWATTLAEAARVHTTTDPTWATIGDTVLVWVDILPLYVCTRGLPGRRCDSTSTPTVT